MPFLLLIIGLLVGGFALYRFMLTATPKQIAALVLAIGTVVMATALFFLAITGRLPVAIGIVAAMVPLVLSWWQAKKKTFSPAPRAGDMDRAEALDILGLSGDPAADDIRDAHKRLMKKVHPDSDGSEGLAKRLNEARDSLLKD